eukprot:4114211-Amphidinium_carterae.2
MLSASSCHHVNNMPHVIVMSSCCQHVIFMVIIVSSLRHSVIMVAFSAQRSCKFKECAIITVSSSVVVRQQIFERGRAQQPYMRSRECWSASGGGMFPMLGCFLLDTLFSPLRYTLDSVHPLTLPCCFRLCLLSAKL